ncbi:carotenoid oxygenase family protein [Streptomyces sp. NPDC102406]|uniref:carotenoid oxygenase family protein n=1 Tax=Streptomyces sp. NPDC102406 TaxID=3366171 RepID=UPI0037F1CF7B
MAGQGRRTETPGNPYLRGLFAPVREEVDARDLEVTGRIPAGLDGRFLRNGPNPLNIEEPAAYHWFQGPGMVHGVRLRDGRAEDIRWLEVEPCFVFHPMNAYEDGPGLLTVHLVRYDRLFAARDSHGPDEVPPRLVRWTVDLVAATVREDGLDERAVEFPRIDPRRETGAHRYGYGVLEPEGGYAGDRARRHLLSPTEPAPGLSQVGVGIVKFDLERGRSETHPFHPDGDVGEAVFVPRAGGSGEDDGWLLTYVFDPDRGATDLVVLAAQDVGGEPVARVHLPVRVPVGFHGNWVPDASAVDGMASPSAI